MALYDLYIRRNLSEPNLPLSLVLPAVPKDTTTDSVEAEILWRWEDEPDMKPESLGKTTAGQTLTVPFDMKGRTIRLFVNSRTADGTPAFANVNDTVQTVFGQPSVAAIASATFDTVPDEVTLDISNNLGTGDISIYRQIESGGFIFLDTVTAATTSYVDDALTVDGTYEYKLTQAGLAGESETVSVEVNIGTPPPGGTPPSSLSAFETFVTGPPDEYDVTLAWTAGSGAGNYTVERKTGSGGSWFSIAVVASSPYVDTPVFAETVGRTYYYRVKQNDVTGYSNEASVFIPRDGLGS